MFKALARSIVILRITNFKIQNARTMSTRLFENPDHAKYYAKFRPEYPSSVVQTIVDYYKMSHDMGTAVDVGCGSGQSTYPLTKYFKKVIGIDVSEKQIEEGKKKYTNIEFRVSAAEDLSFLDNSSVNLVTIAQAMHWVDQDAFYKEVGRVLKPGGVLAVYGYGIPTEDKEEAHQLVSHFYGHTLSGFWANDRKLVEQHYTSFKLPFNGWIRNDDLEIIKQWTVDQYIGYISSWSAWQGYLKVYPESTALQTLHERLLQLYPDDQLMTIRWPVFMLLGTK